MGDSGPVRPWGHFSVVGKQKIITVKPNKRLSLQYHHRRDEVWKILKGSGDVTVGDKTFSVKPGDEVKIPKGEKHRVAAGPDGLEFFEDASGDVSEDDIVRLDDDFGRV